MTYFVPYLRKKGNETYPIGSIVCDAIEDTKFFIKTACQDLDEAALVLEKKITERILRIKSKNGIVLFEIGSIPFRLKHVIIKAVEGKMMMVPIPDFFCDEGTHVRHPKDMLQYTIPVIRFDRNNLLSITNDGKFVHSRTRPVDFQPEVVSSSDNLVDLKLVFVTGNPELTQTLLDARDIFTNGSQIAELS